MVLGFSKLLGGFMAILEKIASWVGALFSIIPKTLYLLITFAMQIVDIIQLLFQKLAGLDAYYVADSSQKRAELGSMQDRVFMTGYVYYPSVVLIAFLIYVLLKRRIDRLE